MFKIFEKLGGIEPTLDVIQRRRPMKKPHRLTARAVRDWHERGEIPPVNAVLLMDECRERGIPVDIEDCRLPKKLPRKGSAASRAPAGAGRVSPPT